MGFTFLVNLGVLMSTKAAVTAFMKLLCVLNVTRPEPAATTQFKIKIQFFEAVIGPCSTKICKSYKLVTPIVLHRLNEFFKQKMFVQTFVKRAAG